MTGRRAALAFLALALPFTPGGAGAVGSVTAEADSLHRIADMRARYDVNGKGVTIGVIGGHIEDRGAAIASGDLPADLSIVGYYNTSDSVSTTPILEVLHDIAPAATLLFTSHISGNNGRALDSLIAAGAQIILHARNYVTLLGLHQDVDQDAVRAAAAGVLLVTSVPDEGSALYRASFSPTAEGLHDWGGGTTRIPLRIPSGPPCSVVVEWAENTVCQPCSDFRVRLYDAGGTLLTESTQVATYPVSALDRGQLTGAPITLYAELIGPLDKRLPIRLAASSFGYISAGQGACTLQSDSAKAYGVGGTGGIPEALTVAALAPSASSPGSCGDLYSRAGWSARGPTNWLFPAAETIEKPDLAALGCQSTTWRGGGWWPAGEPVCTSAVAAAIVAGTAALLHERLAPPRAADLKQYLTGSATDLDPPGWDTESGYGQLNACSAFEYRPVPTGSGFPLLLGFALLISRTRRYPRRS